ncbi:MAG TPA: universal stress protein [Bacteroides sp.]|nr:universal stress protein [Bacteroides sp.]
MEEKVKKPILVTWDFTKRSGYALEHGINLAQHLNTTVTLIHIVKKDNEIDEAQVKMDALAEETQKKYNVKTDTVVPAGNIFTTISEIATDIHAEMVIMGTHGMKGMQKLIGSWALKVIAGSKVPFIVVQAPPTSHGFEKIVFPLDFRSENKEKISWIYYIARLYSSTFYIIKDKVTDKKFIKGVTSNLMFTEKFLKSNDIPYEIHTSPGKKDFTHETIDFAHEINADLLLIMTTKNISMADYVIGANEQQIISNHYEIPVMCVNPRPGKFGHGFSATGG